MLAIRAAATNLQHVLHACDAAKDYTYIALYTHLHTYDATKDYIYIALCTHCMPVMLQRTTST